jgi:phosphotransferase system IIB component
MIASVLAVTMLTTKVRLTLYEQSLIKALATRNVSNFKKVIRTRVSLFTIIGGAEAKMKSELDETYLVACDRIATKEKPEKIKLGLERLSKVISISLHRGMSEPKYMPKRVKSIHNDLTRNTIRGLVGPDDFWELHYGVKKDGRLVLRRVCEFDHASKFVW